MNMSVHITLETGYLRVPVVPLCTEAHSKTSCRSTGLMWWAPLLGNMICYVGTKQCGTRVWWFILRGVQGRAKLGEWDGLCWLETCVCLLCPLSSVVVSWACWCARSSSRSLARSVPGGFWVSRSLFPSRGARAEWLTAKEHKLLIAAHWSMRHSVFSSQQYKYLICVCSGSKVTQRQGSLSLSLSLCFSSQFPTSSSVFKSSPLAAGAWELLYTDFYGLGGSRLSFLLKCWHVLR